MTSGTSARTASIYGQLGMSERDGSTPTRRDSLSAAAAGAWDMRVRCARRNSAIHRDGEYSKHADIQSWLRSGVAVMVIAAGVIVFVMRAQEGPVLVTGVSEASGSARRATLSAATGLKQRYQRCA